MARPGPLPELLAQANRLHQAGHLAQAEALYCRCLDSDPADANALYFLAGLRQQMNARVQAIDLFEQVLHVASSQVPTGSDGGLERRTQVEVGKTKPGVEPTFAFVALHGLPEAPELAQDVSIAQVKPSRCRVQTQRGAQFLLGLGEVSLIMQTNPKPVIRLRIIAI